MKLLSKSQARIEIQLVSHTRRRMNYAVLRTDLRDNLSNRYIPSIILP